MNIYISICIPTKGRLETVKRTLDSIFADTDVDYNDFEVVLSDNSDNDELKNLLKEYQQYPNIVYGKTSVEGFYNSISALQMGKGSLLKLHNDYTRFNNNSLRRMIAFVKSYVSEKPYIYFSNNELNCRDIQFYDSFDDFNYHLSFLGTWSTGFAIWKEDFDKCPQNNLNRIFPHTQLLFEQYYKKTFLINDESLFSNEIIYTKGGYNLFNGFAVQYLAMVEKSFQEKHLSKRTFEHIKGDLFKRFLIVWYYNVKIAKNSYTYDLSGIKNSILKYYSVSEYYYMIGRAYFLAFLKKIKKLLLRRN